MGQCGNPKCVNPIHLKIRTHSETASDSWLKNRRANTVGYGINTDDYLSIAEARETMKKAGCERSKIWLRMAAMAKKIRSEKFFNTRLLLKSDVLKAILEIKKEGAK